MTSAAASSSERLSSRVVVVGGGSGGPMVLRGLSRRIERGEALEITAIVATADDGGSSGRIRRDRGGLPPGDLRKSLVAMTNGDGNGWAGLFEHRFGGRGEIAGHALGNLMLAALVEREGDWLSAVRKAERMLGTRGTVLPASLVSVRLAGEARDGTRLRGETHIGAASALRRVWLEPPCPPACPGVPEAIAAADLVVIAPGSLFTSLLPVLLVDGVAEAIRTASAPRLLVSNLMTQPGETTGMDLLDHVEAIETHVGSGLFDAIIVHGGALSSGRLAAYAAQGAAPVRIDRAVSRGDRVIVADLVTASGKIRHDPDRLAQLLLSAIAPGAPVRSESGGANRNRARPGKEALPSGSGS